MELCAQPLHNILPCVQTYKQTKHNFPKLFSMGFVSHFTEHCNFLNLTLQCQAACWLVCRMVCTLCARHTTSDKPSFFSRTSSKQWTILPTSTRCWFQEKQSEVLVCEFTSKTGLTVSTNERVNGGRQDRNYSMVPKPSDSEPLHPYSKALDGGCPPRPIWCPCL